MSEVKFAGQVALVTGASRGIGAAIAAELVAKGLIVIGTATSDEGASKITAGLTGVTGAAAGLVGIVKSDQLVGSTRSVDLWQAFAVRIAVGDHVRLQAGCDRTSATCKTKFANFLNFLIGSSF
mgnify:CR=1 FL=1